MIYREKHRPFQCSQANYEHHLRCLSGGSFPVFKQRRKRLHGAGFFGSILRTALPLAKTIGKKLLKKTANTGLKVASDVMSGQNFKQSLKNRSKQAGKELFHSVMNNISPSINKKTTLSPSQKRKTSQRKRKKPIIKKKSSKKQKIDIFS